MQKKVDHYMNFFEDLELFSDSFQDVHMLIQFDSFDCEHTLRPCLHGVGPDTDEFSQDSRERKWIETESGIDPDGSHGAREDSWCWILKLFLLLAREVLNHCWAVGVCIGEASNPGPRTQARQHLNAGASPNGASSL